MAECRPPGERINEKYPRPRYVILLASSPGWTPPRNGEEKEG